MALRLRTLRIETEFRFAAVRELCVAYQAGRTEFERPQRAARREAEHLAAVAAVDDKRGFLLPGELAQVSHDDEIVDTVAGPGVRGVGDPVCARHPTGPRVEFDSALVRVGQVQHDVAVAFGEVRARGYAHLIALGVTAIGNAGLNVELQALEIVFQDDVDDAGHGIGAVHGGRPAGNNFDSLDERRGNGVQVNRGCARLGADVAPAVDENERPLGSQRTQVDEIEAGAGKGRGRGFRVCPRADRRQLAQQIADVDGAGGFDLLRPDNHRRRRCGQTGAGDP